MAEVLKGYIGLGSNLGDRLALLKRAVELLEATAGLSVLKASGVYESPSWGYQSAHDYLNAAVEVEWDGPPLELAHACYRIEAALGRHPGGKHHEPGYHDRSVDLDLLWLEGIEVSDERLTLPHPRAHLRAFVLIPWRELAPKLVLCGRSLTGWLANLPPEEVAAVKLVEGAELMEEGKGE